MIDDPRPDGSALARFTRDLTADARAGRLETVRCRDEEIARTIDILLRQGKNNPALVGQAGVGKTAIAEGLALRIADGKVPIAMRDLRLLSLDAVGLLAGTTYRGQYEERLRALVVETSAAGDVLLFVDEMHNLIGQGSASGSAMDAANMLKPALARGEFRMLGATTDEEYERWILGDPALERRFQKIAVRELSPAETLEILRTRIPSLARHHNVVITDAAVRAAIELTDLWVPDRRRPDKAIDALDEACAHTQATAVLSATAEELIARRRLSDRQRAKAAADAARPAQAQQIDRMARDGMAVLERLGAELEAAFVRPQPVGGPPPAPVPPSAPTSSSAPATRAERAALDVEIERQLQEEGIVVRGHDVARVVGLMTGRRVEWEE
ncbi:MAG: ATP-dependent Clp protease ATP-binding subunit [Gemmatimonadaceae bacterium]|nr:ATP-dependent Clp protease ATP-binding subunit [Gemmatimonadaceae bacterium]NUS32628.1 ATP-dependent Clp protease ATP-binding subunit [Gemmatimonadaceae bacterium]